jgi:hypothetical protein
MFRRQSSCNRSALLRIRQMSPTVRGSETLILGGYYVIFVINRQDRASSQITSSLRRCDLACDERNRVSST